MKKKIKKELDKYSLWILIGTVLPIIIYLLVFGANGLSLKNTNWSDFGSFIGGYATLVFGAANLYFLIKVAYSINNLDEKRNKQNKIDSVRPLGILRHEIDYNSLSYKIVINNFGLGPLIVKNYFIKYNKNIYNNFIDLIPENNYISQLIKNNKFYVGANNNYIVFEINYDKTKYPHHLNIQLKEKFEEILNIMKSVELTFECEDLFENKVELHIK